VFLLPARRRWVLLQPGARSQLTKPTLSCELLVVGCFGLAPPTFLQWAERHLRDELPLLCAEQLER
jgi:hypothetical protein